MRSIHIGYLIAARLSVNIVSGSYAVSSSNTLKEEPLGMGEGIKQIMCNQGAVEEHTAHFWGKCCSPHAFYQHHGRLRGFPISN